ncbi:MAG TPA: hypothetical protein VFV66_14470, partial [Nonomuraea sp.]|nr:hypothetical protein [Nonomuraea sp.]
MALPSWHEGPADRARPEDPDDRLTGFPPFHERVLRAVAPVCARYGLALAGGYAFRAHGLTDRPSTDLDLATAMETPLPDVAGGVVGAFQSAGLRARVIEVTPRFGRLRVEAAHTGETCGVDLLREALQRRPVAYGGLRVVALDDAVGLTMRAVHERSLASDIIDIASVAHLYSCRALEH